MIAAAKVDALPVPSPAMVRAGIGLRHASPEDLDWLRDLYCASRTEELATLGWTADLKRIFLADQFRLQHLHYGRAWPDADRLIVTYRTYGSVCDIGRLYIDRTTATWRLIEVTLDASVRNRGIGTTLLKWLIASARDAMATAIDLHVTRDNADARRFYETHGFRQTATLSATHAHLQRALQPIRA